MLSLNHGVYIIEKGYKKTVCPDGKYFHQNKLFFIFTLIIFSEHSYFLRKSQITPERKQRKKRFFNSICTPPEHPDSPQNLYLWAFSQFSPLLKLNTDIYMLYLVKSENRISSMDFLNIPPRPRVLSRGCRHFGDIIYERIFIKIDALCSLIFLSLTP